MFEQNKMSAMMKIVVVVGFFVIGCTDCQSIKTFGSILTNSAATAFDSTTNLFDHGTDLFFNESITRDIVEQKVPVYLYTVQNRDLFYKLYPNSIKGSPYNASKPTKIITHGWTERGTNDWMTGMKNEYLKNGTYNVILVDWNRFSRLPYTLSASHTKNVGNYVGDIVTRLVEDSHVHHGDFHCTGHSLGAHVCGFAGKRVLFNTGKKIGRITGLDPAGPLFQFPLKADEDKRLSNNDAEFVDVIHTSGGTLGFSISLGHVDFYPNGGTAIQLGCSMDALTTCSHSRSIELFSESINSNKFTAKQCDSVKNYVIGWCNSNPTVKMGLHLPSTTRGDFYLRTNSAAPFAII